MTKSSKTITLAVIAIALAMGVGLFYWFEWRPAKIRKDCVENTLEVAKKEGSGSASDYELVYSFCLRKHGLAK